MRRKDSEPTLTVVTPQKHASIIFLFGIPANFLIGGFCTLTFFVILSKYRQSYESWLLFLTGALAGVSIIGTSAIPKLRTILHEGKHALLVIATGNKIKDFHVDTHTGHVVYDMYQDKLHFAPFIMLAPYFFPLLSMPVLFLGLVLDPDYHEVMAGVMGFALASDLCTSISELHPHQTDLRQVRGGLIVSLLYLAGFHFMWCSVTLLWVLEGRDAFAAGGDLLLQLFARTRRG